MPLKIESRVMLGCNSLDASVTLVYLKSLFFGFINKLKIFLNGNSNESATHIL